MLIQQKYNKLIKMIHISNKCCSFYTSNNTWASNPHIKIISEGSCDTKWSQE